MIIASGHLNIFLLVRCSYLEQPVFSAGCIEPSIHNAYLCYVILVDRAFCFFSIPSLHFCICGIAVVLMGQ